MIAGLNVKEWIGPRPCQRCGWPPIPAAFKLASWLLAIEHLFPGTYERAHEVAAFTTRAPIYYNDLLTQIELTWEHFELEIKINGEELRPELHGRMDVLYPMASLFSYRCDHLPASAAPSDPWWFLRQYSNGHSERGGESESLVSGSVHEGRAGTEATRSSSTESWLAPTEINRFWQGTFQIAIHLKFHLLPL